MNHIDAPPLRPAGTGLPACTPAHAGRRPQRVHRAYTATSLSLPFRCGQGPVLVVVGDAGGLTPDGARRAFDFALGCVVPAVVAAGARIITGGTDVGVMAVIGRARCTARADFQLIGVVPEECVDVDASPDRTHRPGMAVPEPHHTDIVLMPGDRFGTESRPMMALADQLAGGHRVVVLVIGGGAVTRTDVEEAVAVGHTLCALSGSGGVATSLLVAAGHTDGADPRYLEWAYFRPQPMSVTPIAVSANADTLLRLLTRGVETS